MPVVCYYKPNRKYPRKFTEKDAARIVCRVVREGGDPMEIRKLMAECMGEVCEYEEIEVIADKIIEGAAAIALGITAAKTAAIGIKAVGAFLKRFPAARRIFRRLDILANKLGRSAKEAEDLEKAAREVKVIIERARAASKKPGVRRIPGEKTTPGGTPIEA